MSQDKRQTDTGNEMVFWACRHPKLGFLTFKSYKEVGASVEPKLQGCYTNKESAVRRTQHKRFYVGLDRYKGSDVEVVKVVFTWRVEPCQSSQ